MNKIYIVRGEEIEASSPEEAARIFVKKLGETNYGGEMFNDDLSVSHEGRTWSIRIRATPLCNYAAQNNSLTAEEQFHAISEETSLEKKAKYEKELERWQKQKKELLSFYKYPKEKIEALELKYINATTQELLKITLYNGGRGGWSIGIAGFTTRADVEGTESFYILRTHALGDLMSYKTGLGDYREEYEKGLIRELKSK